MHTRNYFLSLHDALPISSALSEATGREIRFAVTVDESLMLDDEDEDPQPSSGVTSSVTQRDAHDVDSDVARSGHDVPTVNNDPPFRRGEGPTLPEGGDAGRAATPGADGPEAGAPC